MFSCVGDEPGSLPRKVRKGEGEPPSNYDITGHDKIRMDQSISRTLPFQRHVVDRKKVLKKIDSITKDLKIPRDKPPIGQRLQRLQVKENDNLFFQNFIMPNIRAMAEKNKE